MGDKPVITGCGATTAVANSAVGTWSALCAGASGVRPIDRFDPRGFACDSAAVVSGLCAEGLGVNPRDARIMGLPAMMILGSGREAMVQAGLSEVAASGDEMGFFAGMGMVDPAPEDLRAAALASCGPTGIDYERFFADSYREIYPLWPLAMLNNVGFCLAGQHLGVRGENAVFSPGADSALLALVEACAAVVAGRAAAALAGGASEPVSARSLARAQLARGWRGPDGGCPLGESAAVVVVESEAGARARGAVPLALVSGWGFSQAADAFAGFNAAMTAALKMADPALRSVDAVMLHGEPCGEADEAEKGALSRVLEGQKLPPLCSSKELVGHGLAGGAAIDVVLAVCILANGMVPKTLAKNAKSVPPVEGTTPCGTASRPRRLMVNARSWAGACASVVLDWVV